MRILGMNELWDKLTADTWTTFRFPRADKDWRVEEVAQVVYKPRSRKDETRAILGIAEIIKKDLRWVIDPNLPMPTEPIRQNPDWDDVHIITEEEARKDGFESREAMIQWIARAHDARNYLEPMNKIRLRWTQIWLWMPKAQAPDTMTKWAEMLNRNTIHGTIAFLGVKIEGALPPPTVIYKSGYLVPLVFEREKQKLLGIEPPVLILGDSKVGEASI